MIILNNLFLNMIFFRKLSRGLPKLTINPVVSYNNAEIHKSQIFKENIKKSFVYR
jgi:hypothetical protein